MSDIKEALVKRLRDDTGVAALIAARIYPLKATQDTAFPCLVYNRIDSVPERVMGMASGLFFARFQIDSWGKSASAVTNLASKVRTSLDGFIGSILGVDIGGVSLLDEADDYDDEVRLYRVIQNFGIWYTI
jgi:hypothetical protein